MMEIGYTTEDPAPEYAKMLKSSRTLDDLREGVRFYRVVAEDALKKISSMSEEDFRRFKKDLPKMRKAAGKEAERLVDEWGDIVMPQKMMTVSLIALQHHAPWGLAFMRCEETGWKMLERK